jgi:type VI protein secretion system component VasA
MKKNLSGILMLATILCLFFAIYSRLESFSRVEKATTPSGTNAPLPVVSHEPHILFLPE